MKTEFSCLNCLTFVGYGEEVEHWSEDLYVWIEKCDRCLAEEEKKRAEVARLEEIWAARVCAADGCDVVFTPAHPRQRFHHERCRIRSWRAQRRGLIV